MLKKAIAGGGPLEAAVFELQDKLQAGAGLEGRPAAIEALMAVTEFLSVISRPEERLHQRPFNQLISALKSLDDGKVLPLLKPARWNGRSRNSLAKESAKGEVVFTVRRLCDAGLAEGDAHERVAAVCRKAGMLPGRTGARDQRFEMTARTVRGWCAEISADVACKTRAARQCASLMGPVPYLRGNDAPDVLLERLQRFLVETFTTYPPKAT